jgi:hypothetical protein
MTSTKDVLDHHIKCFGVGDLTGSSLTMRRVPSCSRRTDRSGGPTRFGRCSRRCLRSLTNLVLHSA